MEGDQWHGFPSPFLKEREEKEKRRREMREEEKKKNRDRQAGRQAVCVLSSSQAAH